MLDFQLVCSNDFVKHRPHIHYLLLQRGSVASAIATYNSNTNKITFYREGISLLPAWAKDFIEMAKLEGSNNEPQHR